MKRHSPPTGDSDDSDDQPPGRDLRLERRSYLTLAGVAAASIGGLAGCSGVIDGDTAAGTVAAYGYGGAPMQVSAATLAATAIAESEPNDRLGTATAIRTDADVSATLDAAEVDWYRFSVDGDFDVVFDRDAATGITGVVVYDDAGEMLDLRYVGADAPAAVTETDASGTYYVEIVNIQESAGSYTLRIDTAATPTTTTTTTEPTTTTTTTTTEPTTTTTTTTEPTTTSTTTTTTEPTTTTTTTTTSAPEDDYAEQGYGQLGYGGST
ncbi:carbohydrate-binding protein [Halocalculus aciditolerans]|uniref:Peptidase C-terminal archaeal/bacterial domain-containing protein n=1 Tax=Halocalculus aciditolerans TaxID=1383812 RepID=A0A830FKP0_9EURY|nr:carbohydrate-binding protein [Halocalculus aciditolerans]GGL55838.1 hypothetical protein GCM10009039_12530 [Halocalculus aciditolerans]